MKSFLKILGAAALLASVTPYKIKNNQETGEKTIQALLWKVSSTVKEDGDNHVSLDIGFYPPHKETENEMFADDIMEPVPPMDEPLVVSSDDVESAVPSDFEEPEHFSAEA